LKNTSAPPEVVAVNVRFEEQFSTIGGSTTVTVKLQLVLFPQLSLAVTITMFVPTGKKLPLAGEELMFNGPHPPAAVKLKNTNSPLFSAAVTVMFEEQFRTIGG
jgi:hypothetical protein